MSNLKKILGILVVVALGSVEAAWGPFASRNFVVPIDHFPGPVDGSASPRGRPRSPKLPLAVTSIGDSVPLDHGRGWFSRDPKSSSLGGVTQFNSASSQKARPPVVPFGRHGSLSSASNFEAGAGSSDHPFGVPSAPAKTASVKKEFAGLSDPDLATKITEQGDLVVMPGSVAYRFASRHLGEDRVKGVSAMASGRMQRLQAEQTRRELERLSNVIRISEKKLISLMPGTKTYEVRKAFLDNAVAEKRALEGYNIFGE